MALTVGRFVCAVLPFGQPAEVIKNSVDTNSIIGYDQFCRLKRFLPDFSVEFFDSSESYGDSDVLIIMSTIYTIPIEVLKQFKRVIYFYDDLDLIKAAKDNYRTHLDYVGLVLHPEPEEVENLKAYWDKSTYYMPWSSAAVPPGPYAKKKPPSVFVDIDDRAFTAASVKRGISFIRSISGSGIDVYVPGIAMKLIPDEVVGLVREVPRMPHNEFLGFVSQMTFYASGIFSSYEYVVMESALLGCGLVSLYHAVRRVHRGRASVLDYNGEDLIAETLLGAISSLDQDLVISTAKALYPIEAVNRIPNIISEVF